MYQPKFVITNKILKNIGAIEAAKEVIENAPLVPYYEKQFQSEAIARMVHHSTRSKKFLKARVWLRMIGIFRKLLITEM